VELIVASTCFKRQKNKLASYVSGSTASAIKGPQTVVRTTEGDGRAFNVKVGLHQG